MRWALLLVVVTGCGRIGFGNPADGSIGGGDDAPGGGGDAGGDGAMLDTMIDAVTMISPSCGTTVIIDDGFATAGNGAFSSVNTGVYTMTETGGVLRIGVPVGTSTGSRAAMQQTAMQSFVGTCAIAELSLAGNSSSVRAYLRLGLPAKNIEVYVETNQLWGRFNVNSTTGSIGPVAYNAQAMRFLRLREIGNRNYAVEYGASLTGAFQMLGSQGGAFSDPSPSSIEIGVIALGDVSSSTTVEFERVLLLGP